MIALLDRHRAELDELCLRHHVKKLEVFGSAAAEGVFDPARSDIDFLVDFHPLEPSAHALAYFGLWFALEELFQRRVDLVEAPAVSNPYFWRTVNQHRQVL